jgi:hypothetical protein
LLSSFTKVISNHSLIGQLLPFLDFIAMLQQ